MTTPTRTHTRSTTAVPGPLSELLASRKTAAVADGVSTTPPWTSITSPSTDWWSTSTATA